MEKSDTADIIVGQKSGPALAGPAGPATTALCFLYCIVLHCFVPKVIIQSKRVISYVKGAAVLLICLCTAISKNLIVCVIYL